MRKLDKIHNDIGMTAPAQDVPAQQKQSKKKVAATGRSPRRRPLSASVSRKCLADRKLDLLLCHLGQNRQAILDRETFNLSMLQFAAKSNECYPRRMQK